MIKVEKDKTIYNAPGKIILCCERAVVYGEPAISCAIDLRTKVKVGSLYEKNTSLNLLWVLARG